MDIYIIGAFFTFGALVYASEKITWKDIPLGLATIVLWPIAWGFAIASYMEKKEG